MEFLVLESPFSLITNQVEWWIWIFLCVEIGLALEGPLFLCQDASLFLNSQDYNALAIDNTTSGCYKENF